MSVDNKVMRLVFSSELSDIRSFNSSFDSGILRICYHGENRNQSFISKDTLAQAIPSAANCPIVCRYIRETDEIGAHDAEVVRNEDDSLKLVNMTQPVGVVPESAKIWWEEIAEDDGTVNEYLCATVLLWKRQEAYQTIKSNGIVDQSMEISVLDGDMRDGVYHIQRLEFQAFCLLGTAAPCFESASLAMFSQGEREAFANELSEMMREFKASLNTVQYSEEVGDIHITEKFSKGGRDGLDKIKILLAEFNLTEEQLDFDIQGMSVDELRAKFEGMAEPDGKQDASNPQADSPAEFKLSGDVLEALFDALGAVTIQTPWGEGSKYWYTDHDFEASEVYCVDSEDYKLYGFSFTMNGDVVNIDFESKKRKKFTIVDFDGGNQLAAFAKAYEKAVEAYSKMENEWGAKYTAATETALAAQNELSTLQEYKAEIEKAEFDAQREGVFSCFEDLSGNEMFESLRTDSGDLSVEAIEEKCFAIRGRAQTQKFSTTVPKVPKLPIPTSTPTQDEPYGGLFDKYGVKKTKQED